jgi:hypothetical protein
LQKLLEELKGAAMEKTSEEADAVSKEESASFVNLAESIAGAEINSFSYSGIYVDRARAIVWPMFQWGILAIAVLLALVLLPVYYRCLHEAEIGYLSGLFSKTGTVAPLDSGALLTSYYVGKIILAIILASALFFILRIFSQLRRLRMYYLDKHVATRVFVNFMKLQTDTTLLEISAQKVADYLFQSTVSQCDKGQKSAQVTIPEGVVKWLVEKSSNK